MIESIWLAHIKAIECVQWHSAQSIRCGMKMAVAVTRGRAFIEIHVSHLARFNRCALTTSFLYSIEFESGSDSVADDKLIR